MSHDTPDPPVAVEAAGMPPRAKASVYPEPFAARVAGREKRPLGDPFGLTTFGVNLTRLAPGAQSALLHRHTKQDEFVYVLSGTPTLVTEAGEQQLAPGMCVGFAAGGAAHHLVNNADQDATILEVGDRTPGDGARYPDVDLVAEPDGEGGYRFSKRDGTPY